MAYSIPTVKSIKDADKSLFTVVSTFAGGGGSSTGYRMAGGKVLAINEFVEEAQTTYASNWPDTLIIPDDVRTIEAEMILKAIGLKAGELDIFDGSPPCSAFSSLGSGQKGWGDKVKQYSDKSQANIENLFFEYIRILDGIQPKVFVAENVAGLTVGSGKGFLNEILRGLKACGYHVEAKVMDAKWCGIPQTRRRLIIVGVRNDLMKTEFAGKLHPKPMKDLVTLGEAFRGLTLSAQDKRDTDMSKQKVFAMLKKLARGEAHAKRFSLKKDGPHLVSNCITASTGKIGAAAPKHWDNRAYSVAETKRIMSIPDDYILTGTWAQQVERLGRMVPPLMMKAVANNLYRTVLNGYT